MSSIYTTTSRAIFSTLALLVFGGQIAVHIDPTTDQSLFINANGWGAYPQIVPQDEAGCLFYVDGSNTLPMLFGGLTEVTILTSRLGPVQQPTGSSAGMPQARQPAG